MTPTESSGHERLAKRRRYRRLTVGLILGGVASALVLRELNYPLVGEALYWLGVIAAIVAWIRSPVSLFDERDVALERRAAHRTISLFAVVLAVGASVARVLTWVTDYTVPTAVWGALWGYVALFAVFAVAYGWLRYRP